jgi:ABC-type sugar transport system substrate-binding protein
MMLPLAAAVSIAALLPTAALGQDDAAACAAPDAKIAMNHPIAGIPFYNQISDGGRAAAADCGAQELQVIGPTDFNLEATVQAVRDALAAGVNGIALNSFPPDLWVPVVEKANESGVPMVAFNAGAVDLGDASPLYVGVNEFDVGRALGGALGDVLGPDASGTVVAGICSPGFGPLLNRVDGMAQALSEKSPGVTVSEPFDTGNDLTKSFTAWSDLIQANPDAVAFAGVCSTDLPNLVKIKQADAEADYLIAGADIDLEALSGIEDGTAVAMVGQSPYLQGYIPVRMLLESVASGEPIPSGWIDSGVEVVTKDNAAAVREREGSIEATKAFYAPLVEAIFADPAAAIRPLSDLAQ